MDNKTKQMTEDPKKQEPACKDWEKYINKLKESI